MKQDDTTIKQKTEHIRAPLTSESDSSALLSDVVHRLGHDIGNPLTSIISLSSILERFSGPDSKKTIEEQKLNQYSASIAEEAWKISSLSESMVFLLSQRAVLTNSCDLDSAIRKGLAKVESRCGNLLDNIEVEIISSDIASVEAEFDRLVFIIAELVKNAAYATKLCLETETIEISSTRDQDNIVLRIANRIPKPITKKLEDLLKPLVQDDENKPGAGLGLAAVLNIASKIDASISLEEHSVNEESYFAVELLFKRTNDENEVITSNANNEEFESIPSILKVIVVDDETVVSSAISKMLEAGLAPNKVECLCCDGDRAIELITSGAHFDIMLCDLNLSAMSGRHVYEQLLNEREKDAERFVFLTGDKGRPEAVSYLESVGRPFLFKPFGPQELLDIIDELLFR